jgi:hypothetical protein
LVRQEVIMAIGSSSNKAPQAQIAFESAIGAGCGFEVGPLPFQPVIVDLGEWIIVPTDVADVSFFGFVSQVIQSRGIAVQTVGYHVCLPETRGISEGDVQGATGILCRPSGREEPTLEGIELGVFSGPDPSFLASNAELGLIGKEPFMRAEGDLQGAEILMEVQGDLVIPSGDGVVRDVYTIELFHDLSYLRSGNGVDHGEVGDQSQGVLGEVHFVPGKRDSQLVNINSLNRVAGNMEDFSGQRHIDLVGALSISLGVVLVASEPIAVGEMFEDSHGRAAFRTGVRGILFGFSDSARDELMSALEIFASVTLLAMKRVFSELVGFAFAPWTENRLKIGHNNSFRYGSSRV